MVLDIRRMDSATALLMKAIHNDQITNLRTGRFITVNMECPGGIFAGYCAVAQAVFSPNSDVFAQKFQIHISCSLIRPVCNPYGIAVGRRIDGGLDCSVLARNIEIFIPYLTHFVFKQKTSFFP